MTQPTSWVGGPGPLSSGAASGASPGGVPQSGGPARGHPAAPLPGAGVATPEAGEELTPEQLGVEEGPSGAGEGEGLAEGTDVVP